MQFGDETLPKQFWERVRQKADGCWQWVGCLTGKGYGSFYWKGRTRQAHKFVMDTLGRSRPGLVTDHLCRNRACCNPDHLETVTIRQNLERSPFWNAAKTHCPKGHPYREHVKVRVDGRRRCAICHRDQKRDSARRVSLRKRVQLVDPVCQLGADSSPTFGPPHCNAIGYAALTAAFDDWAALGEGNLVTSAVWSTGNPAMVTGDAPLNRC